MAKQVERSRARAVAEVSRILGDAPEWKLEVTAPERRAYEAAVSMPPRARGRNQAIIDAAASLKEALESAAVTLQPLPMPAVDDFRLGVIDEALRRIADIEANGPRGVNMMTKWGETMDGVTRRFARVHAILTGARNAGVIGFLQGLRASIVNGVPVTMETGSDTELVGVIASHLGSIQFSTNDKQGADMLADSEVLSRDDAKGVRGGLREGAFFPRIVNHAVTAADASLQLVLERCGVFDSMESIMRDEALDGNSGTYCLLRAIMMSLRYGDDVSSLKMTRTELTRALTGAEAAGWSEERIAELRAVETADVPAGLELRLRTAMPLLQHGHGLIGVERLADLCSRVSTADFRLAIVVRGARAGCNKPWSRRYGPEDATHVAKVCLDGGHFWVDADIKASTMDKDNLCRVAAGEAPIRSRVTPFSSTWKLVTWLLGDEAMRAGVVSALPADFHAVRQFAELPEGDIDNAVLQDRELLHSFCEPVTAGRQPPPADATIVVDFETFTTPSGILVPTMVQWCGIHATEESDASVLDGRDCAVGFAKHLLETYGNEAAPKPSRGRVISRKDVRDHTKRILLFAHNSGFDASAALSAGMKAAGFVLTKVLPSPSGPVTITFESTKHHLEVELRDSNRVLGDRVADLPETWSLGAIDKEMMLHSAIRASMLADDGSLRNDVQISALVAAVHEVNAMPCNKLAQFDAAKWVAHIGSRGCVDGDIVRLRDYMAHYGRLDVVIVARALRAFDAMILELCNKVPGIDKEAVSMPSSAFSKAGVADSFYRAAGVFRGVFSVSGPLMTYLKGFVFGGRTTLGIRTGEKPIVVATLVDCVDARSLYPTAMVQLGGYPTGLPEGFVGSGTTVEQLNAEMVGSGSDITTAWFAELVYRGRKMPRTDVDLGLIPRRGGETLSWTNDLFDADGNPFVTRFDHISHNTFCRFHGLAASDFEVVRGVKFVAPVDVVESNTLAQVTQLLYDVRAEARDAGNEGMANTCKILLNSSYGRLLMRWHESEVVICHGQAELNKRIRRYGARVSHADALTHEDDADNVTWALHLHKAIGHKDNTGRYHCGALVLSQSRAVMANAIHLAAAAGSPIHYTDTDSLFVDAAAVPEMERLWARLMPEGTPPLIGPGLGQFGRDLAVGKEKVPAIATRSVFLGRKSYALQLTAEDGSEAIKIRMKGNSKAAVQLAAAGRGQTVMAMYEDLASGDEVKFDNSAGGKVRFEMPMGRGVPNFSLMQVAPPVRTAKFA